MRKNFIPRQEEFQCEHCHHEVPLAKGTFRDHCPECLYSKHVDDQVPGDRAATCQGLLEPVGVEGTDPDKLDILYRCEKCDKTGRNRTAPDDNKEAIWGLMAKQV